jgi:hypothetical protein
MASAATTGSSVRLEDLRGHLREAELEAEPDTHPIIMEKSNTIHWKVSPSKRAAPSGHAPPHARSRHDGINYYKIILVDQQTFIPTVYIF